MIRLKLYGPPGCGKTTNLIRDWIKPFLPYKDKIAVVSLTRATAQAFKDSLIKQNIDFSNNIKTMHAWAHKALKAKIKDIMIIETKADLMQDCLKEVFNAEFEMYEIEDMRNFIENMEYSKNPGVAIWQACTKVRTTWDLTTDFEKEHLPNFIRTEGHNFGITDHKLFYDFYLKYYQYKKKNNLYDFTDLLIMALQGKINPFETLKEKFILIIDEVQDLYPLAFRVFQRYESEFDTVIIAGDDDQTIYSFCGANPELFLNYSGTEIVLNQSYRLPRKIHEYALKIISQNKIRKPKNFLPTDRDGKINVVFFESVFDLLKENVDTLLLARTKFQVQEYIKFLEDYHIPYKTILNVNASEKIPRLVQIHENIKNGKEIKELSSYLETYLEEVVFPYIKIRHDKKRLRKNIKNQIKESLLTKDPARAGDYSTAVREILNKNLDEISTLNKELVQKWYYRLPNIEKWFKPNLRVGTIHSAKGLESERVIIDPRITQRIQQEMITEQGMESERRVWYVAVTRAINELFIINSPLRSFYRTFTFPLPEIQS